MRALGAAAASVIVLAGCGGSPIRGSATVDRVVDGDTIRLTDGRRVRLVQIDAPETSFGAECYGRQATEETRRLLPRGTIVRLDPEPKTDDVDGFGRLLRYVVRERDGLDVNLALVSAGAAAPYFYAHRRGGRAAELERAARAARARGAGLWGACPGTPYDPGRSVATGRLIPASYRESR